MAVSLGPSGLTLGSETKNDWADVGGGGSATNYVEFKSGSGTWTVPAGVSKINIIMAGGGGAAGASDGSEGSGSGGGSAGASAIVFTQSVTAGSTLSYSIGSGGGVRSGAGANVNYPGYGNNGGTTTLSQGSTWSITCPGGQGRLNPTNPGSTSSSGTDGSIISGSSSSSTYDGAIGEFSVASATAISAKANLLNRGTDAGLGGVSTWAGQTDGLRPGVGGGRNGVLNNNHGGGHGGGVAIFY